MQFQEHVAVSFARSRMLAFIFVMKNPSVISEITLKRIEGAKAGWNDGGLIFRALWESRAEAKQQDKSEKQVAVENRID